METYFYISNFLSCCHFGEECGRNGLVSVAPRVAPICAGECFEEGDVSEQCQCSMDFLLSSRVPVQVQSNRVEIAHLVFQLMVKTAHLFALKHNHIDSQNGSLRYALCTVLGLFSKKKII